MDTENIGEHFEQIDFVQAGRDFVKTLAHSATNSVLTKILFPILLISPLSPEDELKYNIGGKKGKKKHKNKIRENSMPSHISVPPELSRKKSSMKTTDNSKLNSLTLSKTEVRRGRRDSRIKGAVKADHKLTQKNYESLMRGDVATKGNS
jgi:hypothetical protein